MFSFYLHVNCIWNECLFHRHEFCRNSIFVDENNNKKFATPIVDSDWYQFTVRRKKSFADNTQFKRTINWTKLIACSGAE